jgi:REP element-mobilizing transposase RayT
MELLQVYFWTNTIKDWKNLLQKDKYKALIIDQLKWLCDRNKIVVYGFVLMPNHMHLLWELVEMNGKEKPHASFNKWTSSNFLKDLRIHHPEALPYFTEETLERNHRFWQRDPLAILMDTKKKFEQKLEYVHLNPLQEKWNLAKFPEEYKWSSARFYESGNDEFGILTHYMERF